MTPRLIRAMVVGRESGEALFNDREVDVGMYRQRLRESVSAMAVEADVLEQLRERIEAMSEEECIDVLHRLKDVGGTPQEQAVAVAEAFLQDPPPPDDRAELRAAVDALPADVKESLRGELYGAITRRTDREIAAAVEELCAMPDDTDMATALSRTLLGRSVP